MITEVDDALRLLLGRSLPEGTAVRLDPPKPTWQTERPSNVIDLFLFGLRGSGPEKRPAAHRCRLSYLVTAHAGKVVDEHLLLDRALRTVIFATTLPADCLAGSLAETGEPVFLSVSDHDPGDLWSNLGMPARAAFVVTVSAAYPPDDRMVH
ncbi:Pvc16 family protein [Actinokineospora iranica]|uniref:Pvc16 N-terminal domain-containing protein n=1 Tax=Actinokineospora iranica TaxID=1271860 RepID=A0A1G6K9R7_9PSEU|nr:Pvc16 family protein [Actinokineospora iranica]SDC27809.1 Protein of unknown function [Actinokineospora iranica]